MCLPAVAMGVVSAISAGTTIASNVAENKIEKKNLEYRTQIALNNAKNAQNEALRQKQLGLEGARAEKIQGIKQASLLAAKASTGGFDITSGSNLQNYQDIIDSADTNAEFVKNNYNYKSDNYLNKSKGYLNQIKEYQTNYNASVYKNALNSLGSMSKVAQNWYQQEE